MLYISFAWTTEALYAGKKIVTRRRWKDSYAELFIKAYREGKLVGALDKSFRNGGKRLGVIYLIKEPYKQNTSEMRYGDFVDEGLCWMQEQGMKIQGKEPFRFFVEWGDAAEDVWVIKFAIKYLWDSSMSGIK